MYLDMHTQVLFQIALISIANVVSVGNAVAWRLWQPWNVIGKYLIEQTLTTEYRKKKKHKKLIIKSAQILHIYDICICSFQIRLVTRIGWTKLYQLHQWMRTGQCSTKEMNITHIINLKNSCQIKKGICFANKPFYGQSKLLGSSKTTDYWNNNI